MRAPFVVAALLTTLAACALPAGSGTHGGGYEPLRAFVSGPELGGGLGFQLNRPAYVAIFEVMPGRGTSLVYPYPGSGRSSGYAFSGRAHLGSQRFAGRDIYLPTYGHGVLQGPTFYLLIASEQPMNLDRLGAYGMGLRSALGNHWAAYSPYQTMERLAETVLPSMADDGSWTSDLYVHWPQALARDPDGRSVLLNCNGYQTYVRLEYVALAYRTFCMQQNEVPTERTDSAQTPAPGVEIVPRRRPAPEGRSGLQERVRTSSQMEERQEARERRTPGGRMGDGGEMRRAGAGVERSGTARRAGTTPGSGEAGPVRGPRGQPQERGIPGGDGASTSVRTASPSGEAATRAAPDRSSAPATPAPAPTSERCADC